jgi:6-phosphofructokinase 2
MEHQHSVRSRHEFVAHAPIVTLTVNPALDLSTSTDRLEPEHKLRCGPSVVEAGGGGVNVSRVIGRLGGSSTALVAVGGATGGAYRELLAAEAVALAALPGDGALSTELIPISGSTRQNITIDESSTGQQFRFVLRGPTLSPDEGMLCLDAVDRALPPTGGFLVLSGSLPPGAPDDLYARAVQRAREHGARVVVDASGAALAAAVDAGPHLIKPSARELRELAVALGLAPSTIATERVEIDQLVDLARQLVTSRGVGIVALTLGALGAAVVTADEVLRLSSPDAPVLSTVGAGDSFLGAMVLRLAQGRDLAVAARAGVAAGAATASMPGTQLGERAHIDRLERALADVDR